MGISIVTGSNFRIPSDRNNIFYLGIQNSNGHKVVNLFLNNDTIYELGTPDEIENHNLEIGDYII